MENAQVFESQHLGVVDSNGGPDQLMPKKERALNTNNCVLCYLSAIFTLKRYRDEEGGLSPRVIVTNAGHLTDE
ncbi:hypothetical protein EVAR_64331_1 [Eumeta japonica]|uniref:Uncharacterized protein n=1 Tax=Eumeta variegata TaxID=151549 RepID=A0A4C1ZCB9_EUMVA|nr:hypothetical protein EVAR_64331_1 [Eumeta japonica]